jgi:outer membrane protein assembly factor BamE (lipoprotein component of BamABCDE complex)
MERGFTYRLVADLIQALETEGYQIGTGQYLRVQELLHQLPDGMPAEELMYALSPLFVQTSQQQDQFYRLFQQARDRTEAYFHAID